MNKFEQAAWEVEKDDCTSDGMSQENCIEFIKNCKTATVTLSQGRLISKVRKLASKYPDDVKIKHTNADGSIVAHIPVSYIHIGNYGREMSDEQKAEAAERFREYHKNRKAASQSSEGK